MTFSDARQPCAPMIQATTGGVSVTNSGRLTSPIASPARATNQLLARVVAGSTPRAAQPAPPMTLKPSRNTGKLSARAATAKPAAISTAPALITRRIG